MNIYANELPEDEESTSYRPMPGSQPVPNLLLGGAVHLFICRQGKNII